MQDTYAALKASLRRPVVFIGLMGAGKTVIGRMLAQALDLPFFDADVEIETATGRSVAQIFEQDGEPAFRKLEQDIMTSLLADGGTKIVSTGGGAVMTPAVAELVWSHSVSVWLRAELGTLVERTSRNQKRPLLKAGRPEDVLGKLMDARYPVYAKADLTVDTADTPHQETLDRVALALYNYLKTC